MIKTVLIMSQYDLDYLFAYHTDYLISYLDDVDALHSAIHLDSIDYILIDYRFFPKYTDLYKVITLCISLNYKDKVYLLLDDDATSLLFMTTALINEDFQNMVSMVANIDINEQLKAPNYNDYMIVYDEVTGNWFRKRKIKKHNKVLYQYYANMFYQKKCKKNLFSKYSIFALIFILLIAIIIIFSYFYLPKSLTIL